MSAMSNRSRAKDHLRSILAEQTNFNNEESIFCTQNNLEQSLNTLNEVISVSKEHFIKMRRYARMRY